MREVLSFLTKIPIHLQGDIENIAKRHYLFPIAGIVIGLLVGSIAIVCFYYLPPEIAAGIVILSLYSVTGLMHLDGVADVSDGIMANGDKNKKIKVMKDVHVGIAGIFSVIMVLMFTYVTIRYLGANGSDDTGFGFKIPFYSVFAGIIIAELSGKLGICTCIAVGKKINGGLGSVFIKHASPRRFLAAVVISALFALVFSAFDFVKTFVVFTGVLVGAVIAGIGNKNFGGVNGDCMGAACEFGRTGALVILCLLSVY